MTSVRKNMLAVINGERPPTVPMWLMRQAGRYLPEYRALRATAGSFMGLCFNPLHAAEVTLQPLRRFDLDAAILFSDILVIPHAMGQDLSFVEGEGPRLVSLNIDALDITGFQERLLPIYETVKNVRRELAPDKTLIGFAGSPWTIACYMIEGRGTGEFLTARKLLAEDPKTFYALVDKIVFTTIEYLSRQIASGADCVQLFDSWAGLVSDADFTSAVIEPTKKIVDELKKRHPDTPIIGFPRGCGKNYARYVAETGVDAVGIDQSAAINALPENICVQGNLDPEILLAGGAALEKAALRIISDAGVRPFIFNLGHGVIKETPPEHVAQLVSIVKSVKRT